MTTNTRPLRCKCSEKAQVISARKGKQPTRHYDSIAQKLHPAYPFKDAGVVATHAVVLVRCKACGQHWQVDSWNRGRVGWMSYPDIAIKVSAPDTWQSFDDRPIRRAHFAHFDKGVENRSCGTPGCKDLSVTGFDNCANCLSKNE